MKPAVSHFSVKRPSLKKVAEAIVRSKETDRRQEKALSIERKMEQLADLLERDEKHEEEFIKNYLGKVQEAVNGMPDMQKLKLVDNYEDSLHEYMILYLTLCIKQSENQTNTNSLTKSREAIIQSYINSAKGRTGDEDTDSILKQAEQILKGKQINPVVTKLVLLKLRTVWGPIGALDYEELKKRKFQEKSIVLHKSKNTEVALLRHILDNFIAERDSRKGRFEAHLDKKELNKILNTFNKPEVLKGLLEGFYMLQDCQSQRRKLLRTGRLLAYTTSVVGVGLFAAGIVGIPLTFGASASLSFLGAGLLAGAFGAGVQGYIGYRLLPQTDYKASAFGKKMKAIGKKLKGRRKHKKDGNGVNNSENRPDFESEMNQVIEPQSIGYIVTPGQTVLLTPERHGISPKSAETSAVQGENSKENDSVTPNESTPTTIKFKEEEKTKNSSSRLGNRAGRPRNPYQDETPSRNVPDTKVVMDRDLNSIHLAQSKRRKSKDNSNSYEDAKISGLDQQQEFVKPMTADQGNQSTNRLFIFQPTLDETSLLQRINIVGKDLQKKYRKKKSRGGHEMIECLKYLKKERIKEPQLIYQEIGGWNLKACRKNELLELLGLVPLITTPINKNDQKTLRECVEVKKKEGLIQKRRSQSPR